jgi:hypothetical protein
MSAEATSQTAGGNIPFQVFDEFLRAAQDAGVQEEVVHRLRKTLVENRIYTEAALKAGMLGDETLS